MASTSIPCAAPSCTIPDLIQQGDGVFCSGCSNLYHYGCAGVQEATQRRRNPEAREKWRCPQRCRDAKRSASVEKKEAMGADEEALLGQLSDPQLRAVFNLINRKMNTFMASNEFVSAKYDEVMARLAESEEKNKELRALVESQGQQIQRLEIKLHTTDQASRDDLIEIHGIEKVKGEKAEDVEKKVSSLFKAWNLEAAHITKAHRIYSKNDSAPPILVKFSSVLSRNKVLRSAKKVSDRSQGLIFPNARNKEKKIFIGESLNSYYKKLLYNTKGAAKEKGFKFAWVVDGKILVRKNEGAKAIRISSMRDVETLLV